VALRRHGGTVSRHRFVIEVDVDDRRLADVSPLPWEPEAWGVSDIERALITGVVDTDKSWVADYERRQDVPA
jgi:hypothetical protein